MLSLLKRINNEKVIPYIYLSFPVLLVFGLTGYPLVYSIYLSLFDYKLMKPNRPFVGLRNYTDLFLDRIFMVAFWNSLRFTFFYLAIVLLIGLAAAIIIYHLPPKIQNVTKSVYFLPVITSMIPVAIAFMWLLRPGPDAPLNYILSNFGIKPIGWLTDKNWAFGTVVGVTVWKNMGFVMIIYLAGLLGIPQYYFEAAKIDGANSWQSTRLITLPLLKNTTVFLVVTGFISAFQVFTQVFVMARGNGPEGSTATLGYEIYYRGFMQLNMGSASAMGFVMMLFILIATAVQLKYFGGDDDKRSKKAKGNLPAAKGGAL